jgi:hypothetical protein
LNIAPLTCIAPSIRRAYVPDGGAAFRIAPPRISTQRIASQRLYTLYYNFIRAHGKLRMARNGRWDRDHVHELWDVLARIDAANATKARGTYKKRATA